eukprot:1145222-Pelagomonas_calceolata.AAC.13
MEAGEEAMLDRGGVAALTCPPGCDVLLAPIRGEDVVVGGAAGGEQFSLGSPWMGTTALCALLVRPPKQESLELRLTCPPEQEFFPLLPLLWKCVAGCGGGSFCVRMLHQLLVWVVRLGSAVLITLPTETCSCMRQGQRFDSRWAPAFGNPPCFPFLACSRLMGWQGESCFLSLQANERAYLTAERSEG